MCQKVISNCSHKISHHLSLSDTSAFFLNFGLIKSRILIASIYWGLGTIATRRVELLSIIQADYQDGLQVCVNSKCACFLNYCLMTKHRVSILYQVIKQFSNSQSFYTVVLYELWVASSLLFCVYLIIIWLFYIDSFPTWSFNSPIWNKLAPVKKIIHKFI